LEDAPVVAVSARTGDGIEELKAKLREAALAAPARDSDTVTRLPVDRSFTMRGFGAVVTGTLVAGEIAEGQELELLPAGARVVVLEGPGERSEIVPGAAGLVQLRLESPVVALPGDRFILRTYSPQQTVAGGEVLDAHAPKHRGRERAAARARLASLAGADAAA